MLRVVKEKSASEKRAETLRAEFGLLITHGCFGDARTWRDLKRTNGVLDVAAMASSLPFNHITHRSPKTSWRERPGVVAAKARYVQESTGPEVGPLARTKTVELS